MSASQWRNIRAPVESLAGIPVWWATTDRLGGRRRVTAPVKYVGQTSVDVFCSCHLFLSPAWDLMVPSLTSHIFFLLLTTTCSCLKTLNPPCVCVNNESPDKCYTKMKKGLELLVFMFIWKLDCIFETFTESVNFVDVTFRQCML